MNKTFPWSRRQALTMAAALAACTLGGAQAASAAAIVSACRRLQGNVLFMRLVSVDLLV